MFNIPTVTVASETLGSADSSVTLDYAAPGGVSWTPRHLLVRVDAKSSEVAAVVGGRIRFNGDTGNNYSMEQLYATGTSPGATIDTSANLAFFGALDGSDSNEFGGGEFLITDALSTRSHKSFLSMSGAGAAYVNHGAGRWADTAAITSVTYFASSGNLAAGSTIELCVVDESFNIDEQIKTAATGAGSFTVGSISAADGDLVCIGNVRSDREANWDAVDMKLNSDATGGNYQSQWLYAVDTGTQSYATTSSLQVADGLPDENNAAGAFGAFVSQITNFSDGADDRVVTTFSGAHAPAVPHGEVNFIWKRWNNTSAVTTVDYEASNSSTGNFVVGSMLSTYAVPKNLITRTELTGDTYPVTISSIPDTYDHLELSIYAKASVHSAVNCQIYFNGETSSDVANYKRQLLQGRDSAVSSNTSTGDATHFAVTGTDSSSTAEEFSSVTFTFYNYKKTDRFKHFLGAAGFNWNNRSNSVMRVTSGRWADTAAITSITINPNDSGGGAKFVSGSVFTLRGISATIAPASDITKVNTIALASIQAMNGITVANAEKLNGITF